MDIIRANQLTQWIRAAPDHELLEYDDEVMWGVWLTPDSEDCPPPDAVFRTEEDADAWARSRSPEWSVAPCILDITARNNYDIPR